jgi:hypothetical protein
MSTLVDLTIGAWSLRVGRWSLTIGAWSLRIAKEVSADNAGRRLGLPRWQNPATQRLITALVALWALILCWKGVGWAFHPRTFLILDEVGDLTWPLRVSYGSILHLFPQSILFDRPLGFAFLRFLFGQFGFNYTPQLVCLLAIHFFNCILVFALLRRLGARLLLALAGLAAFGCLPCTAYAATYLGGGGPDVLCTLFLLGSTLALLSERPWYWVLSAMLYLLALRSKEWGIVIPVFLTVLVIVRAAPGSNPRRLLIEVGKRLWIHYLILLVFGACYLRLATQIQTTLPAGTPYHLQPRLGIVYESLVYYTSLITVGWNEEPWRWVIFAALVLICIYALARRRGLILFGAFAYALTLLPVSIIPNQRIPYYAYGPQIFLILTVCLFLEDILDLLWKRPAPRWLAGACAAMLVLTAVSSVRASPSYINGIRWTWMVRETSWRTARDARAQLSTIGPGSHVYVESGEAVPWLFAFEKGAFLRVWRNDYSIDTTIEKPESEMRALYDRDNAEKYLLDYAPDGSFTTRLKAPRNAAAAAP